MPYDLQVIQAGDFARLDGYGRFSLEASKEALAGLAADMVRRNLTRAILDIRNVQSSLTTTELYELAATFHQAGFRQDQRLAILHLQHGIARADFFAMCATRRGWDVAAFDRFEDAFDWLVAARHDACIGDEPVAGSPAAADGRDRNER
jgi:hypothetical protein